MSAFRSDKDLIRDYVTGADHLHYAFLPEGIVAVNITHSNLPAKHLDIRFDLHTTIEDVKEKLRTHIGTPVQYQRLILKHNGTVITELYDNTKMLGYYSVESGMEIHIIDTDPYSLSKGGGLTDTSLIQKYKISDESYDKRKGTMREYIRNQRALNPNFQLTPTTSGETSEDLMVKYGQESVQHIELGRRCEVMPGARRGIICFVGEVAELKSGYWVGVKLDEPVGKSDGTVKGRRVFECEPKFGAWVRGTNVTVGDFPERDLMDENSDEEAERENQDEEDEL